MIQEKSEKETYTVYRNRGEVFNWKTITCVKGHEMLQ